MKKRCQISVFLVLGIVIIIIGGLYFYISNYSAKTQSVRSLKERTEVSDTDIVKNYAETCVQSISKEALFKKIGLQGGYIDPNGNANYGEDGVPPDEPVPTSFDGAVVPYYIEGIEFLGVTQYNAYLPDLDSISKKLANYIAVEFENCFDANLFAGIGINITKPLVNYADVDFDFSKTPVNVAVSINEEDVTVRFNYPLTIKQYGTETKLESFSATLPIRLKALYGSADLLAGRIKDKQPGQYDITSDCADYDTNGLTNVYLKNSANGPNEIVQFVDHSTFYEDYLNAYFFQFAVKNVNVNGGCVG